MDYLTRLRMVVAADQLATTGASISVIAPAVRYEFESAFGEAFKRVIGQSFNCAELRRGASPDDAWQQRCLQATIGLANRRSANWFSAP